MSIFEISFCNYHLSNPNRDKINRPLGSGDYLFLIVNTEMRILLNGREQTMYPGACIFFTPGHPQVYWAVEKFTNSFVHFSMDEAFSLSKYGIPENELFYPNNHERIEQILLRIYRENLEKMPHFEDMQDFLMQELFIECTRQLSIAPKPEAGNYDLFLEFRNARFTILSNPGRDWNVENMAALMNMGSSQFYNYYHKFFGKSPKAELLEVRIEQAKFLLTNENLSVKQVANQCGFNNLSHFTRYFSKECGVSPSKY